MKKTVEVITFVVLLIISFLCFVYMLEHIIGNIKAIYDYQYLKNNAIEEGYSLEPLQDLKNDIIYRFLFAFSLLLNTLFSATYCIKVICNKAKIEKKMEGDE